MTLRRAVACCLAVWGFTWSVAHAQSGSPVQFTRDDASTMIQKDVGDDEWTITYRIDDGNVTGNVRHPDGSATFLDCDRTSLVDETAHFSCHYADACRTSPCTSQTWTYLSEVELPESFFFPESESGPEPVGFGCCQVGPTCFDGLAPGGCIATRFEWHDGASCELTDEPCPPEIPLADCFLGTCR